MRARPHMVGLVVLMATTGCPPKHAGDRAGDADGGDASRAVAARGRPFILTGPHAIEEAVWLKNGKLLARSELDLYVIDPADGAHTAHVDLPRPLGRFAGANGANTFVTSDGRDVVLWDAETRTPRKTLVHVADEDAGASARPSDAASIVMAPGGGVVAVHTCEGPKYDATDTYRDPACGWVLFDAQSGGRLGRAPRAAPDIMGELAFSDDGAYVITQLAGYVAVGDARTGKERVRRRGVRSSEGGWLTEMFHVADGRMFMSRGSELEVFDLVTGRSVAKTTVLVAPDDETVGFTLDRQRERIAVVSGAKRRIFVWTYGGAGKMSVFRMPEPAICWPCSPRFSGDKLQLDTHTLDLKSGTYEPIGDRKDEGRLYPAAGGWEIRSPCILASTAEDAGVPRPLPQPVCGVGPQGGHQPRLRPDGRFVASLQGGAVRVLDTASLADVAGVGPLVLAQAEQFRTLDATSGPARVSVTAQRGGARLWLTQRPPPPPFDPPRGPRATVERTSTHVFVAEDTRESRIVIAYDLSGKELMRETVSPFSNEQTASRNATLLRTDGPDELVCEVGKGCRSMALHGYVSSFEYPWVLVNGRAVHNDPQTRRIIDLRDGAVREVKNCSGEPTLLNDEPLVWCSGVGSSGSVMRADGSVVRAVEAAKDGPPHATGVIAMPFRYDLGVTNFGLEPGRRTNLVTGEYVDLYFGEGFALARFPDDRIERFGKTDAATPFLFCAYEGALLPWSACSATFDVSGRFEKP